MMLPTLLLQAAAPPTPDPSSISRVALFLSALLALLVVFLLSVALLTLKRSLDRRRASERQRDTAMPDPWREAGQRVQPYEPGKRG